MPIDWTEYELADPPESPEIDWSQYEAAEAPAPPKPLGKRIEAPQEPEDPLQGAATQFAAIKLSPYEQQVLGTGGRVSEPPIVDVPQLAGQIKQTGEFLATSPIEYLPEAGRQVARKVLGAGPISAASDVISALAPKSRTAEIAKGISEAGTDQVEFFTSPLGIATLGIGQLPRMAQRAVSLAFAAQMASQVPEISKQLGDELGKPEDKRDLQKISKLVADGAAALGFSAGAATHGLAPDRLGKIVSAAYKDAKGNVHTGANHPQIVKDLELEGFNDRESRNIPSFGYVTESGEFITRPQAARLAKASGQQLEPFDVDETGQPQPHSDQIESPEKPGEALGDVPQKSQTIEREEQRALQKPEAKEVLPDVQPQPRPIEQPVPAEESDLGIRAGGEEEKGPATREVLLGGETSKPEPFDKRMKREEDMNDWIKAAIQSKRPPADAEEAWKQYTAFERARGIRVQGRDYFNDAWKSFQRESPAAPTEPTKPAVPAETPALAAAKVKSEIAKTFTSEGASTAKEAKGQIAKEPPKGLRGFIQSGIEEAKADRPKEGERGTSGDVAIRLAPPLGIDEFLKRDVAPFLKKGVDAGKALVDIMVQVFSPASRTAERDVDALFEGKGFKEKIITRAGAALEASKGMFDAMSQREQIDFVDRVKRGQRQPTPELQQVADLMRKWDDRLYVMAKHYKPGLPYLENHNRVLWKVVPGSPQARGMSQLGVQSKRPWQGSKGFLRRHVLDDMSQGIALGGVPVTFNPVEMFLLHAQDVMKFVAANRAWAGLKKTGSVEWVRTGQKPPDGYVRISDNIAKPYFRTPTGLLAKTGEWHVEQGAARMIENYLSRDYIRTGKFGPIGRSLLALKNATTAIELGLSPFHAVFESNEVMGSSIGLGLSKLASGKLSGFKDILGAPFSPKTTSAIGKAGIQFAKNPTEFARVYPDAHKWFTSKYPEARKMINDLFAGGGQPAMHEEYRVRGVDGFKKAVAQGNYPGAVLRVFPALNELAMKPLFQTYIPRLKVGMFLREYSFELERNADRLASGRMTRPELARNTWAFIEDRFGELNFDNLYWDRTFKSAMQILFRSVTWKLGNLRGFGKAHRDIWTEALKPLLRGEKPRITLPVAWLGGMAFVTAVQSSIITKVATGKYPWELAKDGVDNLRNLVFPRIDPDDERQRVSVPTYWRDLVHLAHSPVGYVGSSMTGEWRRLYDDLVNRDFYGHPIYNPNDPLQKKVVASLEHLIPLPFGLSSFIGATQEGVGPERAAAGFMGFTKAPSYVSPTSQTQLRNLAMKWKSESKIPQLVREAERQATEQFEPSDYALLRAALKNRNYSAARKALDKLIEEGHKTTDISRAMRPLNKEGKPRPFTGSQLQEKYFIQSLTPQERELYKESVRDRIELYLRFKEMLKQSTPANN